MSSFDYQLRQPKIVTNYAAKDRYIPNKLYNEIKSKRKCKLCNRHLKRGEHLMIHHIKPLSEGGTNHYTNLKAMCKLCHAKVHEKMKEAK